MLWMTARSFSRESKNYGLKIRFLCLINQQWISKTNQQWLANGMKKILIFWFFIDGIRRVTTGELFSEPSTTTEGIKQESGKVAELESSLKSVTESRDSLLSQMASLQKELGAMKKENEDLQVHGVSFF